MKNQSLVDLFEAYDKAFDKACHDLAITNIPDWHERWFYRYLLLNPVCRYSPSLKYNDEKFSKKFIDNYEKELEKSYSSKDKIYDPNYSDLLKNSEIPFLMHWLSPFTYKNFVNWWFVYGKERSNSFQKVMELNFFNFYLDWMNPKSEEDELKKWTIAHTDSLTTLFKLSWRGYQTILIPRFGSKKRIMKEVQDLLDKNHYQESSNVVRTKIPEKTVKACFRVLEHQILFGKRKLLDIASSIDVLSISKAGLNDDYGADSSNSVKVGVHRLSKLGLSLVNATSYGSFPKLDKSTEEEIGVKKIISDFFKLTTNETITKIQSELPPVENMEKVIKSDLKKLGKLIYED